MGTGNTADIETQQHSDEIKVHRLMCTELTKLVRSVSKLLPEIEAAHPRCSGIDALCSLISARDKAQSLLQQCRDSSKLYMALTGDVILKRCIKARNILGQSLTQIQNVVPVVLAVKISRVVVDIKGARFRLDPSEETTGKVLRELLHHNGSKSDVVEEVTSQAIRVAALKLHIASQTALLIEKRSIKKLLEVSAGDTTKRRILYFFLKLLDKYGKLIVEEQKKNSSMLKKHFMDSNSSVGYTEVQSYVKQEPQGPQFNISSEHEPPYEFICPLSFKVMHMPVVIASGETFENMWIQKWFDEGNDTCPKTGKKLVHLELTPNASMKDLISKWCSTHGVTVTDPNIQHPLDISYTSIASLASSLDGLSLPIHSSSFSSTLATTTYSLDKMTTKADDDDSLRFCSEEYESVGENMKKLNSLPWESQLSVVESILKLLNADDQPLECMQYQNFIHPLLRFLKRANDLHDVQSQMCGCQLLLASVTKYSMWISSIDGDAYDLLASFINSSDLIKEALLIWEALSRDELSRSKIGESSALFYILRMLESKNSEFHELLLSIVCNVSEDDAVCSFLISYDIIPKLVPFFEHTTLAGYCARILKNMSHKEAARVSIGKVDGCISSLAILLDNDSLEVQEHAVAVLLSLCSQRIEYCQKVLDEGVIPAFCSICINGNDKGKMMATEILRILKDESNSYGESSESNSDPLFIANDTKESNDTKELKSSSKAARYVGRMLGLYKSSPRKKGDK